MKIISVELSGEVKNLLKEIFTGDGFPEFFRGHMDDYVLHLLQHVVRKCKADVNGEFRDEMRRLAIDAHNAIHYSIQLGSDRRPIDED